jgi:hypothetical protein
VIIENSMNILKNFMNNEKNKNRNENENENEVKNENFEIYDVDNGVKGNFMLHRNDNDNHHNHHNHHDDINDIEMHHDENNDNLENKEKKIFLKNGIQMENNGHQLVESRLGRDQYVENNHYIPENIYYVLARQTLIKGTYTHVYVFICVYKYKYTYSCIQIRLYIYLHMCMIFHIQLYR